MSPMFFHIFNNLLHTINCLLVYFLVKKLEKSKTTAFLSASIFSVHPVLTEAVCGIVGRADLLWSFFALRALSLVFCKPNFLVLILTSQSLLAKEQGKLCLRSIKKTYKKFHYCVDIFFRPLYQW